MTGTLYGIGVGPGDPELITLKAHRLLTTVPILAYPAPENGDSLARSIVAKHLPGNQQEIPIRMPLQVNRFPAQEVYDQAAIDIGEYLTAGQDVAVLCEGDPFFYGSFLYLFARMAEKYPVEVVPGVSSLMACAASLGAPLATRNDILTVLPAPLDEAELKARLTQSDAVAILKVGRHFEKVRRVLRDLKLTDKSRYIEHATMANQRVLPLDDVDAAKVPYFSMVLVHSRGQAWS